MSQTQTTVVVAFSSRCGVTESLALAAAVGAVQGRALIRLRRLPDDGTAPLAQDPPECQEALTRMRKEYVPPTEADLVGNDALILAAPAGATTDLGEWSAFSDMLVRLGAAGKLSGKVAAVVDTGNEATRGAFASLLTRTGFRVLTADMPVPGASPELAGQATACGRRVATSVR